MPALPVIAVTSHRLVAGRVTGWSGGSEAIPSEYLDALRTAGGVPVALGGPDDEDPESLVASFAGLVLVGGSDIDPSRYGEDARPEVYGINEARDEFELSLAVAALGIGVPVLGICRGLQVLNVACGGTLWQHLGDSDSDGDSDGPGIHGVPNGAIAPGQHRVEVTPGSRLAGLIGGADSIERCVSIHHQAVRDVASPFVVTARSPDGQIEALETAPDGPWCLGVQWHPERSAAIDPVQQRLFDGFVAHLVRRLTDKGGDLRLTGEPA